MKRPSGVPNASALSAEANGGRSHPGGRHPPEHGASAVGLEQPVAADELERTGQVGELQVAPRAGIAEVAQRQEPAADDPVEKLLDQLGVSHALGQVAGLETGRDQHRFDRRPEPACTLSSARRTAGARRPESILRSIRPSRVD